MSLLLLCYTVGSYTAASGACEAITGCIYRLAGAAAAGDGKAAESDSDGEHEWDYAPPPAPCAGVVHYQEYVPCTPGTRGGGMGSYFAASGPSPRVTALFDLYERLDGDALFDSMRCFVVR